MKDKKSNRKKHITKQVYWICDKKNCNTGNNREIERDTVLNDDVCDYCHGRIHEPLTIDLNNNDKH